MRLSSIRKEKFWLLIYFSHINCDLSLTQKQVKYCTVNKAPNNPTLDLSLFLRGHLKLVPCLVSYHACGELLWNLYVEISSFQPIFCGVHHSMWYLQLLWSSSCFFFWKYVNGCSWKFYDAIASNSWLESLVTYI